MKTRILLSTLVGISLAWTQAAKADLHRLLVNPPRKTARTPASVAQAQQDAIWIALEGAVAPEYEDSNEAVRTPASNANRNSAHVPGRKSRLPASIADGFELRVKVGKVVSTFWVVKRTDRYDLIFANSAGSKASRGIASDSFNYLQSTAQEIPFYRGDISSCKDSSVQLHVISGGKERSVTSCLRAETKVAEDVRNLGNLLSTMIR